MLIDFTEIPIANSGKGDQDTFELFARDFLKQMGFTIVEDPSRGADGGKDIIVTETRTGISGNTKIKWLVSCKHYPKSKSISPNIEQNIYDRVISNNCDGFMGVYSTLASSGLMRSLEGLKGKIGLHIFDREKIESEIVGIQEKEILFLRYFPKSYKNWTDLHYYTEPIKLFDQYFDQHYKNDKSLFDAIFYSSGNLIKQLRKHDSFENAAKENSYNIIIEPALFEYLNGKPFLHKKVDEWSLKMIADELIPGEIKYLHNITIVPKLQQMQMIMTGNQALFLYPNFIILNPPCLKRVNEVFWDLKKILK